MKFASDFRTIAREALSGRWGIAVVAGLIASLLGAVAAKGPEIKLNIHENGANMGLEFAGQQIFDTGSGWNEQLIGVLVTGAAFIAIAALVMAAAYFILGSIVGVGYSKFNLDLLDRWAEPEIGTLFGYFKHWKTAVAANLLQTLYVILWSLLLVIPGIIARYSYAMTNYILAENPELTASEAIAQSKQMMSGNRWRLFCLQFSFIGWDLLCGLTFGIGNLWLVPYKQTATAAFYREVSGTEQIATPDRENPYDDPRIHEYDVIE